MVQPQIIENPYVVGCNIDGKIIIHPKLKEKPKLYNAVIKHELEHTSKFEKHDLFHDLINNELDGVRADYWNFVLTHPRTWVSFLPIMRINKHWTVDITMTLFWVFIGLTIGAAAIL